MIKSLQQNGTETTGRLVDRTQEGSRHVDGNGQA